MLRTPPLSSHLLVMIHWREGIICHLSGPRAQSKQHQSKPINSAKESNEDILF